MSVSLNLLPDIKKEFVNSQRVKRLFILGAALVAIISVAVVALLFSVVSVGQRVHTDNLQKDIDAARKNLESIKDLDKILTIQNQLNHLPALHDRKPIVSRLFQHLSVVTPNEVGLGELSLDVEQKQIILKGTGNDFKSVNKFVDTLKNAEYIYTGADGKPTDPAKAFSDVVLVSIGRSGEEEVGPADFEITLLYEAAIFENQKSDIKVSVPQIISSQSETERPKPLFDGSGAEEEGE